MPRIDKESKKDDVKDKVKKVTASKSKTSKTPVKKVSKQSKSTSKSDKAVLKDTKESSIKKSKSVSSKKSTSTKSKTRKTKIVKVPSLATDILPVSSETTTAIASDSFEIPIAALCLVPNSFAISLSDASGSIHAAAASLFSLITTAPS